MAGAGHRSAAAAARLDRRIAAGKSAALEAFRDWELRRSRPTRSSASFWAPTRCVTCWSSASAGPPRAAGGPRRRRPSSSPTPSSVAGSRAYFGRGSARAWPGGPRRCVGEGPDSARRRGRGPAACSSRAWRRLRRDGLVVTMTPSVPERAAARGHEAVEAGAAASSRRRRRRARADHVISQRRHLEELKRTCRRLGTAFRQA